jgi:phospholipid transport system substrate-binding protein
VTFFRPLAIALCAALLLLAPKRASAAAAGRASAAVESSNRKIHESLRKFYKSSGPRRERARRASREAVDALLDFDAFAKLTLGKHWASLTPAERARYTKAMKGAMEANYLAKMQSGSVDVDDVKIDIVGEEKGEHTVVKTKVHHGADTVEVNYVIVDTKKGPRAIDVITEGVSLVETYRDQLNTLLPKKGLNGVIDAFDRVRKRAEKEQNEQADRQSGASAEAAPAAPSSK